MQLHAWLQETWVLISNKYKREWRGYDSFNNNIPVKRLKTSLMY